MIGMRVKDNNIFLSLNSVWGRGVALGDEDEMIRKMTKDWERR
jgi:hypothetical protein